MNTDFLEQKILIDSAPGATVVKDGKEYNYFGGTGYFELNRNRKVLKAAIDAIKKYGITSSSSRNSYGTTSLILELEKTVAQFFNCEDAVYLSSGFLTAIAAMQALINNKLFDVIFIDEYSHYSDQYAVGLSGKPVYKYSHLSRNDLEEKISQNLLREQRPLIVTDGIFPVFGEIAPLDSYYEIAKIHSGIIWIDDAHAMGVLGKDGKGTIEHFRLQSDNLYYGGTLSKAFGGFGGIIPGRKNFINEIKNGHLQNGSTPSPASSVAASLMGLKLLKSAPKLRIKLWENSLRLKSGLKKIGIESNNTVVPIAAWTMKSKSEMQKFQKDLLRKKFIIQHLDYIGAGENGVLRIVVFATHSFEQIDNLIYEIKKII